MSAARYDDLPESRANMASNLLLERLEAVLQEATKAYRGQPLFAVEAKLGAQLEARLPGVRFAGQDIRAWAAEISS